MSLVAMATCLPTWASMNLWSEYLGGKAGLRNVRLALQLAGGPDLDAALANLWDSHVWKLGLGAPSSSFWPLEGAREPFQLNV